METLDITIRPEELKYCPRCGGATSSRKVGGKERAACERCGYIFFVNLKVGAGVAVEKEGGILLTKRSIQPGLGRWCLPAGFVEYDESPEEGAVRECQEETGLGVALDGLLGVYHYRHEPNERGILIVYLAHITGGELRPGDDAEEVGFFPLDDLPLLAFRSHRQALADLREGGGSGSRL